MKKSMLHYKKIVKALALSGLVSAASPVLAVDVHLRAEALTQPGIGVPMWGFALDGVSCPAPTTCPATVPGPMITVPAGDSTLRIILTNNLEVPVSIVIPGQPASMVPVPFVDDMGRQRVRSFTKETSPGMVETYTWNALKPGTYLYHSGTHPQVQVQMGLYGAVKHDHAAGQVYPGMPYDKEVTLLYSEVDPDLHEAVVSGNYGPGKTVTSTINYTPKFYLLNGVNSALNFDVGNIGERTLVRLLNAGLKTHVPVLNGQYLSLVAEDGKTYPYAREQYSVMLPALKTVDAILTPTAAGNYPIYDRRLDASTDTVSGAGMLASLQVGVGTGLPVAVNDAFSTLEDTPLSAGVLGNDTGTSPLSASLVSGVSNGTLVLNANGSFNYTPKLNYNGPDSFTYKASSGGQSSNTGTVSITVDPANDAPLAVGESYKVVSGGTLAVGAPGVLANDSDVDNDTLTAQLVSGPSGGSLTLNADGSFNYVPPVTATTGTYTFTYRAKDASLLSNIVMASISVVMNKSPVAVGDMTSTTKNTPKVIAVLANDTDPDTTLDPTNKINPATVQITGPLANPAVPGIYLTQRGGTASASALDGTVTYTPKLNFRGTDMFSYTVRDTHGALSNKATVRVNVF